MSEVQFWITDRPQLFEFEVACCRPCRLRSKMAILEVATSNLQKWRGFAQSWGPCMPIWHPLLCIPFVLLRGNIQPHSNALVLESRWSVPTKDCPECPEDLILQYIIMSENRTKYRGCPDPPVRGTFIKFPCRSSLRPGAMILGKPPLRLFWILT